MEPDSERAAPGEAFFEGAGTHLTGSHYALAVLQGFMPHDGVGVVLAMNLSPAAAL